MIATKLLEEAQKELIAHATHMEWDSPGDTPEPCGQWCDLCNQHIDDDDHSQGHASTCLIARIDRALNVYVG